MKIVIDEFTLSQFFYSEELMINTTFKIGTLKFLKNFNYGVSCKKNLKGVYIIYIKLLYESNKL